MPATDPLVITLHPVLVDTVRAKAARRNLSVPTFCRRLLPLALSRLNSSGPRHRPNRERVFALLVLLRDFELFRLRKATAMEHAGKGIVALASRKDL